LVAAVSLYIGFVLCKWSGLSDLFVVWKNASDNFNATKFITLLQVLVTLISQALPRVRIQSAVGFRVALPGEIKQFLDARHV
jgi:hypothetical protein